MNDCHMWQSHVENEHSVGPRGVIEIQTQGGLQHFVIGGARIAWTWTHAPCMYTPHVVKKNEPK